MEGTKNNDVLIAAVLIAAAGAGYLYMKNKDAATLTAQQTADQAAQAAAVAQAAQQAAAQVQATLASQQAAATPTAPYGVDANGNPLTQAQATAMAAPGYNSIPYNYLVQNQPNNLTVWNQMDTTSLGIMYQYYYQLQNGPVDKTILPLYQAAQAVGLEYGISGIKNSQIDNMVFITKATYSSPAGQVPTGKITPAFIVVPAASVDVTSAYQSQMAGTALKLNLTGVQMDQMAGVTYQNGVVDTLTINYTLGSDPTVRTKNFSRPSTGTVSITLP